MNLKPEELVKALRCCADGECGGCPMYADKQRCQERTLASAADQIERDQKEIAELKAKVEQIEALEAALMGKAVAQIMEFEDLPIARLRELTVADKDGRVIVLPCKVGDTIWRLKRTFETYPDKSKPYTEADGFLLQDIWNVGKNVFLTREEAEKALAEMEGK